MSVQALLNELEARADRMSMPYLSNVEWARLNGCFPVGHDCQFNVIPGRADLWHVPNYELKCAVNAARLSFAARALKELTK